jgi:hypothetical protein
MGTIGESGKVVLEYNVGQIPVTEHQCGLAEEGNGTHQQSLRPEYWSGTIQWER